MAKKSKQNPSKLRTKPLPHRVYPRGNQGTFIYSPDIAVYVSTDEYGIIDLSPFITQFTIQRNVNNVSTFMCSFDNKFSRFDRVLRRMDRIVVFMKRVQWVQVFAGYVSSAPWETVVPGDAQLMAECTLKRLVYTYWDPHSAEAQTLFPKADIASNTTSDSGSAATMFRLLATIAKWPQEQIQIQKIPETWLSQAVKILQQTKNEQLNDPDFNIVRQAFIRLLGEKGKGWLGYSVGGGDTIGDLLDAAGGGVGGGIDGSLGEPSGIEEKWRSLVGDRKGISQYPNYGTHLQYVSGLLPESSSKLASSGVLSRGTTKHPEKIIRLRPDAAASLKALDFHEKIERKIVASYITYAEQKLTIQNAMKAARNDPSVACANLPCPAGISEHGWGTAIDFYAGTSPDVETMNKFGWINPEGADGGTGNRDHWVFVGNYIQGFPAYITEADKPVRQPGGYPGAGGGKYKNTRGQFDWQQWESAQGDDGGGSNNAFKTTYFWPGIEPMSNALTGKRAWINDVPLLESVADMAAASLRDFQSAPNGDFIAFFPDRLGKHGKFPAMQIRDIEITDFKLLIQDKSLVTHYVSVGDMTTPEPSTGIDLDVFINAGYVTVEQPGVMALLLGLPEGEEPEGLGKFIMQRFGIRPRRDDNYDIWNPGFNYMLALHRFQESWASQWNAIVGFTFMPEIFPGMRIELVNYNVGVYVEQVVHSGSRTSGFATTVTVSSPMTKKNGKWVLLPMEFKPSEYAATNAFTDENSATSEAEARTDRLIREGL